MWETQVWSLGQKDPLEKEMAAHYSILAWKIPWTEEPDGLQSIGSQRVRQDWAANKFIYSLCIYICTSVQFSHSVLSDSLQPHGLQHARLPCPSPTPGACSSSFHHVGDAIQPSHPCPLLLPSIFSSIRVFSNKSALCIRWPKYWSFSFNISPSNEYSGLISFRINCLYLLAVQGTLKSLLQHHSSKASVLWCSAFL